MYKCTRCMPVCPQSQKEHQIPQSSRKSALKLKCVICLLVISFANYVLAIFFFPVACAKMTIQPGFKVQKSIPQTICVFFFFFPVCFLRQGLSLSAPDSRDSLCRPDWLSSQRYTCLCLLSAALKGVQWQFIYY